MVLPAPITIENGGARAIRCRIEPIKPSAVGIRYMTGYSDIPDPTWCKVETDTLALEPGESRAVPITLSVPRGCCNSNRCWCVAFSVQTIGGAPLAVAAYPYAYIETLPEDGASGTSETADAARVLPAEPPAGCVTVDRSSIDAGDVPAGTTARAGVLKLKNGYEREVLVEIARLAPPERGVARNVLITPGHKWIEDLSWLRAATRSVLLPAGGEIEVAVQVASPEDPSKFNMRWEGFVEVDGPWGPEALVRVRWRTTAPSVEIVSGGGGQP